MKTAAVIGCGRFVEGKEGWAIGHEHGRAYRESVPDLRLCAVDSDPANLAAFRDRFAVAPEDCFLSTRELYEKIKPDVVSVCTWPGLHALMVMEAAEKGVRGILCEKPMALSPLEIGRMKAACEAAGSCLAVAHQRRHEPIFQRARALLDQGEIGGEWVIEARVGDNWDMLSWTTHWFDMANYLFADRPLSVLGGLHHSGQRRYGHAVEDGSLVLAEYPDGKQALFVTGPAVPGESWFHIRGRNGLMVLHGSDRIDIYNRAGFRAEKIPQGLSPFTAMVEEMWQCLESGKEMLCAVAETAMATEMAYAAHESARTMRRVELPIPVQYAALEILQSEPKVALPEGKIVLFADAHFGSGGREGITTAIQEETGRVCCLVEAGRGLVEEDLTGAGLILIYHTQPEVDENTAKLLSNWVENKRPLLIVHAGLGAYPAWAEYRGWCGRVWAWGKSNHPHQPSRITVVDQRLCFSWSEASLPEDEVFIQLEETSACRDLIQVTIPEGTFPAAWIHEARPNVGVWVPGHRRDLWQVPVLRQCFFAVLQKLSI